MDDYSGQGLGCSETGYVVLEEKRISKAMTRINFFWLEMEIWDNRLALEFTVPCINFRFRDIRKIRGAAVPWI